MTTANPCCTQPLSPARFDALPSFATASAYLARTWQAWRQRRVERAAWRMLDELDDATRRDLGLPERRMTDPHLDAPAARLLGWPSVS